MGVAESTVYNVQPYFWPFQDAAPAREEVRRSSQSSDKVDVLIVGAGPSGLMAATWLSRLGISTRIIDKRGTRALAGRADGVQARTVEILDSFKLGDGIRGSAEVLDDMIAWAPVGPNGEIKRVSRALVWGTETSITKPCTTHQGHIEAVMMDGLKRNQRPVEVERGVAPIDLHIDPRMTADADAYPIAVRVKHLGKAEVDVWSSNAHSVSSDGTAKDEPSSKICHSVTDGDFQTEFRESDLAGKTETIHAKYVIGAEGAHSWVRKKLGIEMLGSSSESTWGVIDIAPITDYPDIRRQGPIISATHEPIVNVPRENGLTRLYVPLPAEELEKLASSADALTDPSRSICKVIMGLVNKALHPYTMSYEYCDWYTVYKVGRRLASTYSDPAKRVFIAGDACHTHTPKAGQGMNVSMQDTHNLGWKLAGVLKGQLKPDILSTYESERRPMGEKLVGLDEALSKGLGGAAEDKKALMEIYEELRRFSDGRSVIYPPSAAVAPSSSGSFDIQIGSRIPNHYVHAQATSYKAQMMDLLPSDGRWRLVVYGGDVMVDSQLARVNQLGTRLHDLVHRYQSVTPGKPWLEVLLIHAATIDKLHVTSFDAVYRPNDGPHGTMSYMQIWADAPPPLGEGGVSKVGATHQALGIDVNKGAVALIRPDAYVAWTGEYDEVEGLEKFCAGAFASM